MINMLKKKEKRDTLLLGFMGLIMVVFVLYIIIPGGADKKPDEPVIKDGKNPKVTGNKPAAVNPQGGVKTNPPVSGAEKKLGEGEEKKETGQEPKIEENPQVTLMLGVQGKLKRELTNIYIGIIKSPDPFIYYEPGAVLGVVGELKNETVDKVAKYSFGDLKEVPGLAFPEYYTNELKLDIFLTIFLVKIKEEGVDRKFQDLPDVEMEQVVDFSFYELINNEIEEDYQLIPVLFYFKHLVQRLHLYPGEDKVQWFREKLKNLKDLTPSKYLVKIKDLINFSLRLGRFNLSWVEEDGLGGDDKKSYVDEGFVIFRFLQQEYLVFPDREDSKRNQWLKDLFASDAGEIELTRLSLQNLDPTYHTDPVKILYMPVNPGFIILLRGYTTTPGEDYFNRVVSTKTAAFHRNFLIIQLSGVNLGESEFKNQLLRFGNFMKKNLEPVLGK